MPEPDEQLPLLHGTRPAFASSGPLAGTTRARVSGPRTTEVLEFDFHGVRLRVVCDDDEIRRRVACDFGYFLSPFPADAESGPGAIVIHAHRRKPDYTGLPPLKAGIYSPRNITYPDGDLTYIDYFGRALSTYDRATETIEISTDRIYLLHEIVFLTILSRVGEHLERKRMHRVHALGIESGGECALFTMPSGGGKTTLALEFLRGSLPYRLISEDSPLIDAGGHVHPFPLRIGIPGRRPTEFAPEHVTYIERMEFEPKYLVSLEAFAGKIAVGPCEPAFLFLGDRTLSTGCVIRPLGFLGALRGLVRHMIVGVGLYQGVEFLLQTSVLDLARKSVLFASRLRRAITLIRRSRVFSLELGRDPAHNARTIMAFLDEQGFGHTPRTAAES